MQTNWISVKDSFPESGRVVLTADSRIPGSIFEDTFMNTPERGKHWIDKNGHVFYCGVSYWMALPELPARGDYDRDI